MTTGYLIDRPGETYFTTFTVVDWVDIFSRKPYRDILLDSLSFCRKEKGLKVFGYVVMTNHMHTIIRAKHNNLPNVIRDFKRHTAHRIIETMDQIPESRKDWMLKRFEFAARSNVRNGHHQVWYHDNRAELILTEPFFRQKLGYIHMNPVKAGWVEKPSDWLYSSARNYMGLPGLIDIDLDDS
jgi:REP element-mobilizing transposase RayT